MRILLFILSLAFLILSITPANGDDLLEWKEDHKLKWSDFKGKVPTGVKYKAMTHSRIGLDADFEDGAFIVDVNTYFIRNKSWSKNRGSESLLGHEQLHFDITELIARKIRKAYSEYNATEVQKTGDFLQTTYDHYYGPVWDSYELYDEETNHGINKLEQAEWAQKIQDELDELSEYSSPRVAITLQE